MPMKAIELANAKVANVTPRNNKIRPYLMLMPAQKIQSWQAGFRTWPINFTRDTVQVLLVSFVKQLYSDLPNFISPKLVRKTIQQIFLLPKFPYILYSIYIITYCIYKVYEGKHFEFRENFCDSTNLPVIYVS